MRDNIQTDRTIKQFHFTKRCSLKKLCYGDCKQCDDYSQFKGKCDKLIKEGLFIGTCGDEIYYKTICRYPRCILYRSWYYKKHKLKKELEDISSG